MRRLVCGCGLGYLRRLELAKPDASLLRQELALLEVLNAQIKEQEKQIAQAGIPAACARQPWRAKTFPGRSVSA